MEIRTPASLPQSVIMRIHRHDRYDCPWREILSALQSIVLRYCESQAFVKYPGPSQKTNTDGHQIPPVIFPRRPSRASTCPRRTWIRDTSSQHTEILASFQYMGSWFLFLTPCFLFVCIWVPDLLPRSNEVLLRGRIKMVLRKPVYHGVYIVFSWGSQPSRDSHNRNGLIRPSLSL